MLGVDVGAMVGALVAGGATAGAAAASLAAVSPCGGAVDVGPASATLGTSPALLTATVTTLGVVARRDDDDAPDDDDDDVPDDDDDDDAPDDDVPKGGRPILVVGSAMTSPKKVRRSAVSSKAVSSRLAEAGREESRRRMCKFARMAGHDSARQSRATLCARRAAAGARMAQLRKKAPITLTIAITAKKMAIGSCRRLRAVARHWERTRAVVS